MSTLTALRPKALYICGEPITQLSTENLFQYAAHSKVNCSGLQWLDDKSALLLFANLDDFEDGWAALTNRSLAQLPTPPPEIDDPILSDHPSLELKIYVSALEAVPLTSSLCNRSKSPHSSSLKRGLWVRPAMQGDMKAPNAAKSSSYYRQTRRPLHDRLRRSSRSVSPRAHFSGGRARRSNHASNLDEELDSYVNKRQADTSSDHAPEQDSSSLRGRISSGRQNRFEDRRRRNDGRTRDRAPETSTDALDDELDSSVTRFRFDQHAEYYITDISKASDDAALKIRYSLHRYRILNASSILRMRPFMWLDGDVHSTSEW